MHHNQSAVASCSQRKNHLTASRACNYFPPVIPPCLPPLLSPQSQPQIASCLLSRFAGLNCPMTVNDVPIELQNEIIRLHWRKLASRGGKASMSRTKRSLVSRANAKTRWAIRRLRHGPTGRKLVDSRLASRLEGNAPGAWQAETQKCS